MTVLVAGKAQVRPIILNMSMFVLVVLVSMHNNKAQELPSHPFDFGHGPLLHVVPLSSLPWFPSALLLSNKNAPPKSHKVRKSSHTRLQGFSRYKHLV